MSDAMRAYFKSQGWPMMVHGNLKPIAYLDKGELIALARKYAAMLQCEFRNISPGVKPDAPVKLMQSHSPAALAGAYFEEAAEIKPGAFDKLKGIDLGKHPGVTWTPGGVLREQTEYATRGSRADHAKRGHGPRGKRELPGARAKRIRKSK